MLDERDRTVSVYTNVEGGIMIFTYKCVRCERLFTDEPKNPNGLKHMCFRCLPIIPSELDLEL